MMLKTRITELILHPIKTRWFLRE